MSYLLSSNKMHFMPCYMHLWQQNTLFSADPGSSHTRWNGKRSMSGITGIGPAIPSHKLEQQEAIPVKESLLIIRASVQFE